MTQIDVKPALDREEAKKKAERERQRKIFVGGLPKNLPDEKLEQYFGQFGAIQKSYVVKDPYSGKTRGFGFVIFENDAGFDKARRHPNHRIEGQEVHIKTAQAKEEELAQGLSTEQASLVDSASRDAAPPGPDSYLRFREPFGQPQFGPGPGPARPDAFEEEHYPVHLHPNHHHHQAYEYTFASQKFQPHEGHFGPAQPGFGAQFYSMSNLAARGRSRAYPPGPQQPAGGPPRRGAGQQPRLQTRATGPAYEPLYLSQRQLRPEPNLFHSLSSQQQLQRDCEAPLWPSQRFDPPRQAPPHPQSLQGRFEAGALHPAGPEFFEPSFEAPGGYFGSGRDFVRPLPPPALARSGYRPNPVSDQAITSTRPHKPVPSYLLARSERSPHPYFQPHPQVFEYEAHWKPTPATNSTLPSANQRPSQLNLDAQAWPGEDEADEEGFLQRATDF